MKTIKASLTALVLISASSISYAETLPFTLSVSGAGIDHHSKLELSDLGEGKTSIYWLDNSQEQMGDFQQCSAQGMQ